VIRLSLAVVALAFSLAGCATLSPQDQNLLQSHGISGPLYETMLHREPLILDDIIGLSQKGVPGPFIVHYLRGTTSAYNLVPGDVDRLQKSGVSETVIAYLTQPREAYHPTPPPRRYQIDPVYNEFPGSFLHY
jgi:hypothetical protein